MTRRPRWPSWGRARWARGWPAIFSATASAVSLLATDHDDAVVEAWRHGAPHPALQLPFHDVELHPRDRWVETLRGAGIVLVAVTSAGLASVLAAAAPGSNPEAVWALATKGWESGSLRTPSEVAAGVLGPDAHVVSVGGPGARPPSSPSVRRPA